MDYFDKRDCLEEELDSSEDDSEIEQFYSGQEIFITGSTGLIGQLIVEKILRCVPSIKKIYLLIRHKKGKLAKERGKDLFKGQIFEKMRLKDPHFMEKVTVVPGNLNQPNLGMNEEHLEQLKSVNIIFHGAADLQFDEHIKTSFLSNVAATKDLIEIAKKMPNLKSFVYISTTYLYQGKDVMEEKFYGYEFSFDEISLLLNCLSDSQATAITPLLCQGYSSVYSLTKVMTENLIKNFVGLVPIGILRPSIVLNTNREPLVGWLNSIQGTTAFIVGSALGFFRVHKWQKQKTVHVIPADKVANSCVAVAWDISQKNDIEPPVYHSVPDRYQVLKWGQLLTLIEKGFYEFDLASEKQLWSYVRINTNNKVIYWIMHMLLEILPGALFDVLFKLQGRKPILMKLYRIAAQNDYFIEEYAIKWTFCFNNERIQHLWNKMKDVDKRKFDFNMVNFDYNQYCSNILKGTKIYLLNETMDDLPKARARLRRLEKLNFLLCKIVQVSLVLAACKLLFSTTQIFSSVYL